jgi:hypothetical protein
VLLLLTVVDSDVVDEAKGVASGVTFRRTSSANSKSGWFGIQSTVVVVVFDAAVDAVDAVAVFVLVSLVVKRVHDEGQRPVSPRPHQDDDDDKVSDTERTSTAPNRVTSLPQRGMCFGDCDDTGSGTGIGKGTTDAMVQSRDRGVGDGAEEIFQSRVSVGIRSIL